MAAVRYAYGVDVAGAHATVVRASRLRGAIRHEVVFDAAPHALAGLAERMAEEVHAGKATLAACVGVHESFARPIRAPFASMAKARKVFPSLLDIQLPFPIEKCICQFLDSRLTSDRQVEAVAVAALKDHIRACLDRLAAINLDPVILDHEGLALWTISCDEMPLEKNVLRVVVYVGYDRTVIAIGRHGQFLGAHSARTGMQSLASDNRSAAREAARQLASRIGQAVSAHVRGADGAPPQWAWTGPGAARPDVLDSFRAALPASLTVTSFTHDNPESCLARALAARALQPDPLRCNFREGALEHTHAARSRTQRQAYAAAGCLAAGLLLCAVNGAWRLALDARQEKIQSAITQLAGELTGAARVPRGQEVMLARRALEERAPLVAPFVDSFSPSPRDMLRRILDVAAARQLVIESASLRKESILINGSAADWNACEALAALLADRAWRVNVERRDAGADERVHFTLKALR